jgi:hypothetical protein
LIRPAWIDDHGSVNEYEGEPDRRFTKSKSNQGVQRTGRQLLLQDPRFQDADLATRRAIIQAIGGSGAFGDQTFDLLMRPAGVPTITPENAAQHLSAIRLVEMKATKKSIRGPALNGFFFGATKTEVEMAEHLGDRYLFAFVVLSSDNEFGRPFARLLTLNELRERTKPWRIQFQVNFKTNLSGAGLVNDGETILVLDQLPGE